MGIPDKGIPGVPEPPGPRPVAPGSSVFGYSSPTSNLATSPSQV
jgi:hypothetical protein